VIDKQLPEKVFIKFNQIEDYYKKSSYGGEVIIANHFDSLFPPNGVWSQYISMKEHNSLMSANPNPMELLKDVELALKGVILVADRNTKEFDAAHEALSKIAEHLEKLKSGGVLP